MKRRITLYLGDHAADLADDGFVLMNYAVTDLTNPAIVKNSWTHTIDLPRTPKNNAIFGSSFRVDRIAGIGGGAGEQFNAGRKTPFEIFTEEGLRIFSGYAKLDGVTRDAYKVTLYGGLGAFIYALAYDDRGNKRTLASLDYGEDLDFTINAQTVKDAWARLDGNTTKPAKWDIINFAPCYNGIPGSDFSADKAVAVPADISIPDTIDGHTTSGGYTMVTLPEAVDEWAALDLRSYLQRPVLSVRKLLAAIADPTNNGGWSVDLTDLAGVRHLDTWLTRPLLPSLGTYNQQGGITKTYSTTPSSGAALARLDIADAPAGAELTIAASLRLSVGFPSAPGYNTLGTAGVINDTLKNGIYFAQAVGYASDNTAVAISDVYAVKNDLFPGGGIEQIASNCGYTPVVLPGKTPGYVVAESQVAFTKDAGGRYVSTSVASGTPGADIIPLTLTGVDIAYVLFYVTRYTIDAVNGAKLANGLTLFYPSMSYTEANCQLNNEGIAVTSTGAGIRSGAQITKAMLLSTGGTPADYLLSLCKTFGLYILADGATKSVQILRRNSFFRDVTEDMTERVDPDSVEIAPLAFDARWYDWKHEIVEGAFAKQYKDTEGVQYGIQRVDTNYDFNADAKDVLAGGVLKGCAAVVDRSKYWAYAYNAPNYTPGVIMYGGAKQTLWDASGNGADYDIAAVTTGIYNPTNYKDRGALLAGRAEFRDADGKGLDGSDCLLFYNGGGFLEHIDVTDDLAAMSVLNGGTPCWILGNTGTILVPNFSRLQSEEIEPGVEEVTLSLELGSPRAQAVTVTFPTDGTIYATAWRAYITDRLDISGKVLKCKARLDGLRVGDDLLRKFFWYRGSLWVLASISNYSLTTFDPAECEFVQVRDKDAYLNGQY